MTNFPMKNQLLNKLLSEANKDIASGKVQSIRKLLKQLKNEYKVRSVYHSWI